MEGSKLSRKVTVLTLGCPKNVVDSELLITQLRKLGVDVGLSLEDLILSDLVIVNTCGFIKPAIEELIQQLELLAEMKPFARIVIVGCAINRLAGNLQPFVDYLQRELSLKVVGLYSTGKLMDIAYDIDKLLTSEELNLKLDGPKQIDYNLYYREVISAIGWAYLKVSEGCSRACGFCTIPSIRGPYRSLPLERIIREAEKLIEEFNLKELVVISQDTGMWGIDIYGKPSLELLLDALDRLPVYWVRIMYLNPDTLTDSLLERWASSDKILKYIDIPVQHVSTKVLRLMRRAGSYDEFLKLFERLKRLGFTIRTTLMVGHPGEGEEDFQLALKFVRTGLIDRLGIFEYSPEEGTPSAKLERIYGVPPEVKRERYLVLSQLAYKQLKLWMNSKLGTETEVLIEARDEEYFYGRTVYDAPDIDGYVKVPTANLKGCGLGDIVTLKLLEAYSDDACFLAG